MDNYMATGIAEGWIECEDEVVLYQAWQHLIDNGQCWQLQGWFGRTAVYLIEQGKCKLPEPQDDPLKDICVSKDKE